MLYVNAIADTVIDARQGRQANQGIDLGAMEAPPMEAALVEEPVIEASPVTTMEEAVGEMADVSTGAEAGTLTEAETAEA